MTTNICFILRDQNTFDDIESLVYACHMGLGLVARVNTNDMQWRIMEHQRKTHRLSKWHIFRQWIQSLPLAKDLITCVMEE